MALQLGDEPQTRRKVEHHRGCANVLRQEIEAKRAVMKAQRRQSLRFGHLVVK
jgi:hypothetical protein